MDDCAHDEPAFFRGRLPHFHPGLRPIFITFATVHRWVLPEAVREAVLAHVVYEHERRVWLHGAVVMPDHVHLVCRPLPDPAGQGYALREVVQAMKSTAARDVNRLLARTGPVWQREWFDRVLRRDEDIRQKVDYLCHNPVRWGLVANADDYQWLWREWRDADSNADM